MRRKLLGTILLLSLLAGCQASIQEPAGTESAGSEGEVSSQLEQSEPVLAAKTPQELLEEQPNDDTHKAFLVDTGGRMGTLLVTTEMVPYEEPVELLYYTHLAVWDPADPVQPIQEIDWETQFYGENQVLDVNFDGYPDFTCLLARGVQVETYHCMIWDEEQGLFVEEPVYAEIPSPYVDPETETISGWSRSSGAGDGTTPIYQWEDGELVCVRKIEVFRTSIDPDSPFVLTVEDRIDGQLTEVFRGEYPLDPGEYFDVRMKWEDLNYHGG